MHFLLSCLQAHLEIQVPTYYAGNDPLLTYATPLHPQEEHTTSREELIGKVHSDSATATGQLSLRNSVDSETSSNSSSNDCVKSWSHDHAYLSKEELKALKVSFIYTKGNTT